MNYLDKMFSWRPVTGKVADSNFAKIGRAIAFASFFEELFKGTIALLHLKMQEGKVKNFNTEENFNEIRSQIDTSQEPLIKLIDKLGGELAAKTGRDIQTIVRPLHEARQARNKLAHLNVEIFESIHNEFGETILNRQLKDYVKVISTGVAAMTGLCMDICKTGSDAQTNEILLNMGLVFEPWVLDGVFKPLG